MFGFVSLWNSPECAFFLHFVSALLLPYLSLRPDSSQHTLGI